MDPATGEALEVATGLPILLTSLAVVPRLSSTAEMSGAGLARDDHHGSGGGWSEVDAGGGGSEGGCDGDEVVVAVGGVGGRVSLVALQVRATRNWCALDAALLLLLLLLLLLPLPSNPEIRLACVHLPVFLCLYCVSRFFGLFLKTRCVFSKPAIADRHSPPPVLTPTVAASPLASPFRYPLTREAAKPRAKNPHPPPTPGGPPSAAGPDNTRPPPPARCGAAARGTAASPRSEREFPSHP